MNCPNCGAFLGDKHICPYCGYEDEKIAQQLHKKEIASIYQKIAALLRMPEAQARKITHYLMVGIAGLICVFLVSLLGSFIYSRVAPDFAYKEQQKAISKLEGYYQSGDFDAMNKALRDIDNSYDPVYQKYAMVGSMHDSLSLASENAKHLANNIQYSDFRLDLFYFPLDQLFDVLNRCRDLEANGFIYSEQSAVAAISQQATSVLKNILKLTDSEIEYGMERQRQDASEYTELYSIIGQRLRGNQK